MGFNLSSACLGLSPPPSPPTAERSENNDTLTSLTASTYASTCPPSPSFSSRVALSISNAHNSSNSSPNEHKPVPQRRRLQHEWKQKSIVRRASSIIQTQVSQMIGNSTFLNRPDIVAASNESTIPLFHRSEVQIGSLIGSGGFSNVYQITGFILDAAISEQCTFEQQVLREEMVALVHDGTVKLVIKYLKRALALSSTKVMSRAACDLMMEATYMSSMNHPHILPIRALPIHKLHAYDAGDFDGFFIIMDELSNTLSDEIQEWKKDVNMAPSITDKMDYALQVASALEYLHSFCRVVYRDLKPSNIGFDSTTGTIQLFDFGLCREIPYTNTIGITRTFNENKEIENENDVYEMSGVGTRRYMAPEIINDGRYNNKVDVYSWSMLVSELITGTKPYVNYDIETHRVAVCQGGERPAIPFQFFPQWIQIVLNNTWCESVTDRWSARQVTYYVSMVLNEDANCTASECGIPQYINQSILQQFPDSPVDVKHLNEIDIYPPDWLLLPNLPDLHDENSLRCSIPANISQIPKRRHTIQERKTIAEEESSGIRFSRADRDDRSNVTKPEHHQHPLTICQVNGNVEIVCRQFQPPAVTPRPLPFHQYRASSCSVMIQ